MTLRQLEVFLAVARARSHRRAAERLHTSQPALSQHVRELETELDVRVFDRLGRSVALTEAGRLLQTHPLRVFGALDSAREALGELQGLQRGSLADCTHLAAIAGKQCTNKSSYGSGSINTYFHN
jgi:DNA-binding transcriptional LysR family regulator